LPHPEKGIKAGLPNRKKCFGAAYIYNEEEFMSEKHPECPLYNPLNCKEYYNPKICAFVRKDKICLKKKKPKAKAKAEVEAGAEN
jgi:hypothetical protein